MIERKRGALVRVSNSGTPQGKGANLRNDANAVAS